MLTLWQMTANYIQLFHLVHKQHFSAKTIYSTEGLPSKDQSMLDSSSHINYNNDHF